MDLQSAGGGVVRIYLLVPTVEPIARKSETSCLNLSRAG
jgi:hypothetical protein